MVANGWRIRAVFSMASYTLLGISSTAKELLTKKYNTMTKDEAIQAMKEGKKVTHRYFDAGEFIQISADHQTILFEDGNRIIFQLFWSDRVGSHWNDGWGIYE